MSDTISQYAGQQVRVIAGYAGWPHCHLYLNVSLDIDEMVPDWETHKKLFYSSFDHQELDWKSTVTVREELKRLDISVSNGFFTDLAISYGKETRHWICNDPKFDDDSDMPF